MKKMLFVVLVLFLYCKQNSYSLAPVSDFATSTIELKNFIDASKLRRIGSGGMGIVYKLQLGGKKYVVKVFKDAENPRARLNVEREIQALLNVKDLPYGVMKILSSHELGWAKDKPSTYHFTFQGRPAIVANYVEGKTLRETIEADKDAPYLDRLIKGYSIAIHVAEILKRLHERKLYHRDIKPDNIIITPVMMKERTYHTATIIDFGISFYKTDTGELLDGISGTPEYMDPEDIQKRNPNEYTDRYALCQIIFEIFSGQRFIRLSQKGSIHEVLLRKQNKMASQHIDAVYVDAHPLLREFFKKGLNANRSERFEDWNSFLLGLKQAFRAEFLRVHRLQKEHPGLWLNGPSSLALSNGELGLLETLPIDFDLAELDLPVATTIAFEEAA